MNKIQKLILNEPLYLPYVLGLNKVNTAIHEDWIRSIWRPGNDSIQGHRGSFKTTCSQLGVLWGKFFNPNTVINFMRKTDGEAEQTVNAIKQFYETDAVQKIYYDGWGVKNIKTKDWQKGQFTLSTKTKITKESEISSGGIYTFKTGSHFDLIVADDIITIADRVSPAKRSQTKLYVNELRNIINPGSIGIKFRGTPWHAQDAWTIMPIPQRFPIGTVPIPDFTEKYIRELKATTTASLYAANYELKHISDENRIFTDPNYDFMPSEIGLIGYLDPAYSGHNHTALAIGGVSGGRIFVRGYVWDKHVVDLYPQILSALKRHNVGSLYVESNKEDLSARDLSRLRGGGIIPVYESENKHMKIVNFVKQNWKNIYFDYECEADFISEILDYEERKEPDDAPDAMAGLIRALVTPRRTRKIRMREVAL